MFIDGQRIGVDLFAMTSHPPLPTFNGLVRPDNEPIAKTKAEAARDRRRCPRTASYTLAAAVPVHWLDEISNQFPGSGSLAPGTTLDSDPLLVADAHSDKRVSWSKIRVNGRHGFVKTDKLSEALKVKDDLSENVETPLIAAALQTLRNALAESQIAASQRLRPKKSVCSGREP
jgi:hypothetical protein